jgi:hypothetical protein
MPRSIALVLLIAFGAGCHSRGQSKAAVYLGGGLMLGGVVIGSGGNGGDGEGAGVALVASGAVLAAIGALGWLMSSAEDAIAAPFRALSQPSQPYVTAPPPLGTPPPMMVDPNAQLAADAERNRRAAWDLTQQARTAAFANDCARVAMLAQRVIELDRPTFESVFSRDPYIMTCSPPPPPPPRSIPIPPLDPTPPPPPPTGN